MVKDQKKFSVYTFLGLPASGKGTQIEFFAKEINAKVLSMGEMIRREIKEANVRDPFYQNMIDKYNKGVPQPDEVAVDILKKNLKTVDQNVIVDNFPFSTHQAELFFETLKELKIENPKLVIIEVQKDEALKRVLSRKVCSECGATFIDDGTQICYKCGGALISRADDNAETVQNRIIEYIPRIEEVLKFYKKQGEIIKINGEQSIEAVRAEIKKKINGKTD